MPHLDRLDAHGRGLFVIALALAAGLALDASRPHAQDANARNFEAVATGLLPSHSSASPRRTLDGSADSAASGGSARATTTDGPAGGTGS